MPGRPGMKRVKILHAAWLKLPAPRESTRKRSKVTKANSRFDPRGSRATRAYLTVLSSPDLFSRPGAAAHVSRTRKNLRRRFAGSYGLVRPEVPDIG
jgi:hypothetical protein